jgi:hypothetical protein
MKIMTSILKIFLPNSQKMADLAAERIADSVNKSELSENIAKYATMSKTATEMADWLAKVLEDGAIDNLEQKELSERLRPLFERITELI